MKLALEGFTAFRERTCLDFSDLDLFAITGPTGAGKSSLIDAIGYALYGEVSRVPHIRACISQGMNRMWVELEFLAGSDQYRVHRETRLAGQPSIRLERWNGLDWTVAVSGAAQVKHRVETIVGLDFDGFTRSVLLPQGRFQEFLVGDPSKRREVLAGLLRLEIYEGIRQRAETRRRDLQVRIKALQDVLDTAYGEATAETVSLLTKQLADLRRQDLALAQRVDQLSAAKELAQAIARSREQLDGAKAQLRTVVAQLKDAGDLVSRGGSEAEALRAQLVEIERTVSADGFDGGLVTALVVAQRLYSDLSRAATDLRSAHETVRKHVATEADLAKAETAASERVVTAQSRVRAANEARTAAITANAAAAVQQHLAPGDLCPVCGSTLGELPHIECPDLSAADAAVSAAALEDREATALHNQFRTEGQVLAARRHEAELAVTQLETTVSRLQTELDGSLPGSDWTQERVAEELARQQLAQARLAELQTRRTGVQSALHALETDLAAAEATMTLLKTNEHAAGDAAHQAENDLRERLQELRDRASKTDWGEALAGVDAGAALERAIQLAFEEATASAKSTQTQIGQIGQRVEDLRIKIDQKQAFERELGGHRATYDTVDELAKVMRADRFGAYVQSEALKVLAEEGSRRLEALSNGRYRLQVSENQQDFDVVDQWNADEPRSVKTLSGGETFLASLALALTMAESLPGLAPGQHVALDSIFIDEGFGSLDPEALERAAEALDALRADDRLVCVVTHLKELADRMPARVEVLKGETGSRVQIS